MAFISVFDVLGPNMIGPSSSHTAGAEIIAFLAQKMIAPPLKRADFTLYGSFAKTYHGHGTDRALLGGIMGFSADDTRIRDSFAIATDRGLGYSFTPNEVETDIHPNTVDIRMENAAGQVMTVRGESLGGGKVRIVRINGVEVDFTGEYNALIVVQKDKPGVVAHITKILSDRSVNIAFMRLFREEKGHTAYTIVESDERLPEGVDQLLLANPNIDVYKRQTLIAGSASYLVSASLFPSFMSEGALEQIAATADNSLVSYISISIPPLLDTLSAVVLAFVLGLCLSTLRGKTIGDTLYNLSLIHIWHPSRL